MATEDIILFLVFFLIGSWMLLDSIRKNRIKQRLAEEAPETPIIGVWSNVQGILVIIAIIFVPIIILLVILWPVLGMLETIAGLNGARETIDSVNFQIEGSCSGACQFDSTGIILQGGNFTLNGMENKTIHQIRIFPKSFSEANSVIVIIGSYTYTIWMEGDGKFYGSIYDNALEEPDISISTAYQPERVVGKTFPILFKANSEILTAPSIKLTPDDSDMVFGNTGWVVKSAAQKDPVRGIVKIGGNINIRKIEIY